MRLKCVSARNITPWIAIWEKVNPSTGKKEKSFKDVPACGGEIEVSDTDGHHLLSRYPGMFKVLSYGDIPLDEDVHTPRARAPKQQQASGG